MLSSLKLSLQFDPEGLERDLKQVLADEWVKHFNDRYFEGDWSGVALRADGGASTQLYSDPGKDGLTVDTPILSRCPVFRSVLESFECQIKSARLLKLAAGARIIEHRDYNLSLEDGEVRLHVPITTSPLVGFFVNGERIVMNPGECWYINANLPHKVNNFTDSDRVHLVIDCKVDAWLRSLFSSAPQHIEAAEALFVKTESQQESADAFDQFLNLVIEDVELQEILKDVLDRQLFFEMVVRLGKDRGYYFSINEVREAFMAKRRTWIERWV